MTDKEKLREIRLICLLHVGDKHSMAAEIIKVINTKKNKNK